MSQYIHIQPDALITEDYINNIRSKQTYLTDQQLERTTDLLLDCCAGSLRINNVAGVFRDLLKVGLDVEGDTISHITPSKPSYISTNYKDIYGHTTFSSFGYAYFLDGPLNIDLFDYARYDPGLASILANINYKFIFPSKRQQGCTITKACLDILKDVWFAPGLLRVIDFEDSITELVNPPHGIGFRLTDDKKDHTFIFNLPSQLKRLPHLFLDKTFNNKFVFKPVQSRKGLVAPFDMTTTVYQQYKEKGVEFLGLK